MLKTKKGDIIGTGPRFMRRRDVELATGLPRSTLWQYVSEGRFPKPLHLSSRVVVWLESEVQA
jgi:prophage regulatory protein